MPDGDAFLGGAHVGDLVHVVLKGFRSHAVYLECDAVLLSWKQRGFSGSWVIQMLSAHGRVMREIFSVETKDVCRVMSALDASSCAEGD